MKKFLIKLSYTVLPLWLTIIGINIYILHVYSETSGDIGKLGIIAFGKEYPMLLEKNMLKDTLFPTINNTDNLKDIHVDVLTIGDSFSQLKNGGYQNYLCLKGITVANCFRHLYSSSLQYAYNLLDEGVIDSTNIQYLVVECVEREVNSIFENFRIDKKEKPQTSNNNTAKSQWSVSRARDFLYYRFGNKSPIYTATLDADFFSSKEPRKLYFYFHDIEKGMQIRKDNESKIKEVYGLLQEKAKEKGIKMVFLVAVDKYDLYQGHIVNNQYPEKTVNEDMERILGKSPSLLLSKQYLVPLIEQGEQDVFKFNDTHWSYKASKIVAEELFNRMKNSRNSARADL